MSADLREHFTNLERPLEAVEAGDQRPARETSEKFYYRLLDRNDLRARGIKYSRPHLDRLMKAGKFPRHIKLGENRNAWLAHEIDAWIDSRIAERDAGVTSVIASR
jgi:prophage regulatory protein